MKSKPEFWFNPLSRASEEMVKQIRDLIKSVVPPAQIRYYEGTLYLSTKGIDLLREACEDGRVSDGKDKALHIKGTLTCLLGSPEILLMLRDLIAEADVDAALLLHCHIVRHERYG